MSETVNVLCYKSKTLKDGSHPLMVRVCKDGKYLSPHDTPTVDMTKAPEKGAFAYSLSCLV